MTDAISGRDLLRGRVVTPRAVLDDAVVEVAGGRILEVRAPRDDDPAPARHTVWPGLVDIHCHGGGGGSFTSGDAEQVAVAAAHHLERGTTTLLPGAVTDRAESMLRVVATLADAVEATDGTGVLAGIHLEGPFLAASRCGAQDPRHLRDPDPSLLDELLAAGRGHVRVMTVAPELPGATALAERLDEAGVVAAVGHTSADASTTYDFLTARPTGLVTHLFNGMPPLHHRAPGAVAGALRAAADGAVVELVADGVHVADDTVVTVLDLLGADRVALVTDAMAAAGMPDGGYRLGPQDVAVVDGVARLVHGDSIAGGMSRLVDVVLRRLAGGAGRVGVPGVLAAASTTPARAVGLRGRDGLTAGSRADLVVLDDDPSAARRVMCAGRWVR